MKKLISLLMVLVLCFSCLSCAAGETAAQEAVVFQDFFANEEINRLVDENHEKVLANGYSELRIPASLHGIPEAAMTPNSWDVGQRLMEKGYSAYVIGGCVRDFIMGKECNDIDLLTSASVEEQREIFGDALGTHTIGERVFGYVNYPDERVDLVTLQNVPAEYAGLPNLPEFDATSLTSDSTLLDSFQRDLSMNAIYYDMATGDLIDYHDGIYDIREGILSTMVDAHTELSSQPHVLLRALRFKAKYGFTFSDDLEKAIREHGREYVSETELFTCYSYTLRMLEAGFSKASVDLMLEYGVLDAIFPSLKGYTDDPAYLDYLEKGLPWLDRYQKDGNEVYKYLAILALLQPVIDRRAETMDYEAAVASVLDEQATVFDLKKVRNRIESAAELYRQMKEESSRFMSEEIRTSKRYTGARALLNVAAQSDESLKNQADFWNELPEIESSHHTDTQDNPENPEDTVEDPVEEEIDEDLANVA